MRKNTLSITALLFATGFSLPAWAYSHLFTISAGVQSSQLFLEDELTFLAPDPHLQDPALHPMNLNETGTDQGTDIGGELAVGYQYNFNSHFNAAIEGFGQLAATEVSTNIVPSGADVLVSQVPPDSPVPVANASFDWLAGVRIRPGIYVTPKTRVFVDGGVVWGGFAMEQSKEVVNFINSQFDSNLDRTENKTLLGWRYGVGAEYSVMKNLVIGVDYTITGFEEFNSDFVEQYGEAIEGYSIVGSVSAGASYVPTFHTLGLNVKYQFGI